MKAFYLGSVYLGFGVMTALNMSAMLRSVSLPYIKDYLYWWELLHHQAFKAVAKELPKARVSQS